MPANYPNSIVELVSPDGTKSLNEAGQIHSLLHYQDRLELIAIETELGTGLRGSLTNLVSRLAVSLNADGSLASLSSDWNAGDYYITAKGFYATEGGSSVFSEDIVVETMTIVGGSITDSTGTISFGNENLSTSGTGSAGAGSKIGTATNYWEFNTINFAGSDYAGLIPHSASGGYGVMQGGLNLIPAVGSDLTLLSIIGTHAPWYIIADDGTYATSGDLLITDFGVGSSHRVNFSASDIITTGTLSAGAITGTSLKATNLTDAIIKADADGDLVEATAGTDYLTTATNKFTKSVSIDYDGSWDTEEVPLMDLSDVACTITAVRATVLGTSSPTLAFNIEERPWGTDITTAGTVITSSAMTADADGLEQTSFSNASIAAKAHLVLTTGTSAASGTVNVLTITVDYTKD